MDYLFLVAMLYSSNKAIHTEAVAAVNNPSISSELNRRIKHGELKDLVQRVSGKYILTPEGRRKASIILNGNVDFSYESSSVPRAMAMLDASLAFLENSEVDVYEGTSLYRQLISAKDTIEALLASVHSTESNTSFVESEAVPSSDK